MTNNRGVAPDGPIGGRLAGVVILLLAVLAAPSDAGWFRGNTHTHTLRSDGDSSPEDVARWYAEHGYHFIVITDHDRLTRIADAPLLLIPGEEITDRVPGKPVHVNAIGIAKPIAPQGGRSVVDVLQRNVDAVNAAGGIAAINHPNFGWAFGAKELLQIRGATLLEIASGHPFVNGHGRPTVEQMWDDLLTAGVRIWAIAADDSHHLKTLWQDGSALPGKAWIVVRAPSLDAASILRAMRLGDFYASTGVELAGYRAEGGSVTVEVMPKHGARYRTLFIGPGGRVLAESTELKSTFKLPAATPWVRAKVVDSNGHAAWLQPHYRSAGASAKKK